MAASDNLRSKINIACGDNSCGDELLTKLSDLGGTNTFTGTNTFSGAVTLSGGATLSGTNTISGATTVSGAATFSTAPTFSAIPIQSAQAVYCTADKTYTTDTSLALVTGLSVTLAAAGIYYFRSHLRVTATANGGIKLALGGTATATGLVATFCNWNTTTQNIHETITALDTAAGDATAACTDAHIEGTIEVNAGGTFTIDAAQNASHADTTTVHKYSSLYVIRLA